MRLLKWVFVSMSCMGLTLSLAFVGIGFAVDRSLGSTAFVSSHIERLSLSDVAKSNVESEGAKGTMATIKLLAKLGVTKIEEQIRGQVRPALDGLYAHLKGKDDKAQLTFSFKDLKKDPKYFLVPNELDLLKIANVKEDQLAGVRAQVMQFYKLYSRSIYASLALVILLMILLRSLRHIAFSLAFSALLSGILLLLPWLFSGAIIAMLLPDSAEKLPVFLTNLGNSFKAAVLGVYVVSPVILLVAGVAALVAGLLVFKKQAA